MSIAFRVEVNSQTMSSQRRKFTDEEKLNVIQQAGQQGVSNILRHYNLSYSVFTRWKKKFFGKGLETVQGNSESRLLLEENTRLKKIIADMALSLEMKNEELKRVHALQEKKNNN